MTMNTDWRKDVD